MTGTNAHVIMDQSTAGIPQSIISEQRLQWQYQRHWVAPPPTIWLAAVSVAAALSGEGLIIFECRLGSPRLAFLHDLCVNGQPVLTLGVCTSLINAAVSTLLPAAKHVAGFTSDGVTTVIVDTAMCSAHEVPAMQPMQLQLQPQQSRFTISYHAQQDQQRIECASGRIQRSSRAIYSTPPSGQPVRSSSAVALMSWHSQQSRKSSCFSALSGIEASTAASEINHLLLPYNASPDACLPTSITAIVTSTNHSTAAFTTWCSSSSGGSGLAINPRGEQLTSSSGVQSKPFKTITISQVPLGVPASTKQSGIRYETQWQADSVDTYSAADTTSNSFPHRKQGPHSTSLLSASARCLAMLQTATAYPSRGKVVASACESAALVCHKASAFCDVNAAVKGMMRAAAAEAHDCCAIQSDSVKASIRYPVGAYFAPRDSYGVSPPLSSPAVNAHVKFHLQLLPVASAEFGTSTGPTRDTSLPTCGSVIITGGTGDVGSQVAAWLAQQGVQKLVLTSRAGKLSAAKLQHLCSCTRNAFTVMKCDVAMTAEINWLVSNTTSMQVRISNNFLSNYCTSFLLVLHALHFVEQVPEYSLLTLTFIFSYAKHVCVGCDTCWRRTGRCRAGAAVPGQAPHSPRSKNCQHFPSTETGGSASHRQPSTLLTFVMQTGSRSEFIS